MGAAGEKHLGMLHGCLVLVGLWECARLIIGCLGEGSKAGKGRDQGGLGRNQREKTEAKGDKRSWSLVTSDSSVCSSD